MQDNLTLTTASKNEQQEMGTQALVPAKNPVPEVKPNKLNEMPTLLSINDMCEYFKVSRVTMHAWMKKGKFPFFKVSRRVYFKLDEVMASMQYFNLATAATARKSLIGSAGNA